ncbi:lysylphosphatidylglycerol synthase domain-containing protein [Streptomyces monticola]|uniref:Lysylphosphatidylglycerol synthase domain-containing protein n=1 Tax=Streptomyces monticola TaxID=2666263 RepID=A0ABW2JS94_9ACTN
MRKGNGVDSRLLGGDDGSTRMTKAVRALALTLLSIAVCVALASAFGGLSAAQLARLQTPATWPALALSVVAYTAGLTVSMYSWRALICDTGPGLTGRQTARLYFVGMISKLIPGRLWGVVAHIRMGKPLGVSPERAVAAYSISIIVTISAGFAAGALLIPGALHLPTLLSFLPLILCGLFVLRPQWVNRLVTVALRLSRRPQVTPASTAAVRRSLALAVVSWLAMGLHLWAIAVLLGADPAPSLLPCVSGFALASALGSLTFVLPDGLGAREVVLIAPLTAVMPLAAASTAVVVSRLVCLVSEVLSTAVVVLVARPDAPRAPAAP